MPTLLKCDCGWQIQGGDAAAIPHMDLFVASNFNVVLSHWQRGHRVQCAREIEVSVVRVARRVADIRRTQKTQATAADFNAPQQKVRLRKTCPRCDTEYVTGSGGHFCSRPFTGDVGDRDREDALRYAFEMKFGPASNPAPPPPDAPVRMPGESQPEFMERLLQHFRKVIQDQGKNPPV